MFKKFFEDFYFYPFPYKLPITFEGQMLKKLGGAKEPLNIKLRRIFPIFLQILAISACSLCLYLPVSMEKTASGLHYSLDMEKHLRLEKSEIIKFQYGLVLFVLILETSILIFYTNIFVYLEDELIDGYNSILRLTNLASAYDRRCFLNFFITNGS